MAGTDGKTGVCARGLHGECSGKVVEFTDAGVVRTPCACTCGHVGSRAKERPYISPPPEGTFDHYADNPPRPKHTQRARDEAGRPVSA